MDLIVDLTTKLLTLGPTPPVRGETLPSTLAFMNQGVPVRLPSGTAVQIGVKSWNNPDDDLLAYCTATRPAADGSPYTFSLSLNTTEMLAKFTAGVTSFDCSIEVKWEVSPGSSTFKKTRRHKFVVDADTIRDTDASPSDATSPDTEWVAHGHAQSLTSGQKLQAATNLGLNLTASKLLGQASSGGTGLPVPITLGTGLTMAGDTLNADAGTSGLTINTTTVSGASAGDILIVDATGALLQKVTPGNTVLAALALTPNGANAFVELDSSARLPTIDGRNLTNIASGAILIQSATTPTSGFASGDLLSTDGVNVTALTPGNGVTAAIANATNATGGLVTYDGALGTPASGDFSAGAFTWPTFNQNTSGSAGTAATLTTARTIGGSSFDGSADVTSFPSPGAIGGTTPSTIAGTTFTGTSFNGAYLKYDGSNTSIGDANTLSSSVSVVSSVALGQSALKNSTTSVRNTAVGQSSQLANTDGGANTSVGYFSLTTNQSGASNTAIGYSSLRLQTSNNATALGYLAGDISNASGGVFIGNYAGKYETGGDCLYIDNQNRTNNAGDRAKALVYGTFASTAAAQTFTVNAGTVTFSGSAVTATSFSGSGASLTALNASNISSGTLADARNTVSNSTTTSMANLATVGTITSGVWNAGAVTSSGAISGTTITASTRLVAISTTVTGRAVQTSDIFVLSTGGTTTTDRTTVRFSGGGFSSGPSAANADANGDKFVFYNSSGGKSAIGAGTDFDMWFQGRSGGTIFTGYGGTTAIIKAQDNNGSTYNSANLTVTGSIGASAGVYFNSTLSVAGAIINTPATLSGAGAIVLTAPAVAFTSTGAANALTLANGTNGQEIIITHVVKGASGTGVLTPTTANGYTTITFTNAGDSVHLKYYTSGGWAVIGSRGVTIA